MRLFFLFSVKIFSWILIRSMEHIDDVKYDIFRLVKNEMGYFSFGQIIMIYPCGLHCDSSISNHHCQIKQWVSIVQYSPLSALLHFSEVISLFSYFSSHFLDPILSFPLLFGSSFSCYILYTYTLVDERFDNKSKEKQYIRNSTEALYFIV